MPQPSNRKELHLHRFEIACAAHGHHVYYLAGLDHGADDAAFFLLRTLRRNGHQPDYDGTVLDLETVHTMLFDKDLEDADIDE